MPYRDILDPFRLLPKGGVGPQGVFRYYDNGGQTIDRYTVVIGKDVYGMSSDPTSPQGFNQYAGNLATTPGLSVKHVGRRIKWADLPPEVQQAIRDRTNGNE